MKSGRNGDGRAFARASHTCATPAAPSLTADIPFLSLPLPPGCVRPSSLVPSAASPLSLSSGGGSRAGRSFSCWRAGSCTSLAEPSRFCPYARLYRSDPRQPSKPARRNHSGFPARSISVTSVLPFRQYRPLVQRWQVSIYELRTSFQPQSIAQILLLGCLWSCVECTENIQLWTGLVWSCVECTENLQLWTSLVRKIALRDSLLDGREAVLSTPRRPPSSPDVLWGPPDLALSCSKQLDSEFDQTKRQYKHFA